MNQRFYLGILGTIIFLGIYFILKQGIEPNVVPFPSEYNWAGTMATFCFGFSLGTLRHFKNKEKSK